MRRSTWWQVLGVAIIIASALWVVDRSDPQDGAGSPGQATSAEAGSLPAGARETLALIDAGGPFPYDRDGAVFMNRERLLPQQTRGFWREYTVPTPGESDRGARRLVVGQDGSVYYTGDHYGSFRRIRDAGP